MKQNDRKKHKMTNEERAVILAAEVFAQSMVNVTARIPVIAIPVISGTVEAV
jgi:CRISPR/Cas system CMR subunit Cmr4 (Cas7 group RAMP superfamily)